MAARRKQYKGGSVVRYEPMDMKLLEEDLTFIQAFFSVWFLRFRQKLHGYHGKLAKYFSINLIGTNSKVVMLSFVVSPDTIDQVT